jgi:hypothetical protein
MAVRDIPKELFPMLGLGYVISTVVHLALALGS